MGPSSSTSTKALAFFKLQRSWSRLTKLQFWSFPVPVQRHQRHLPDAAAATLRKRCKAQLVQDKPMWQPRCRTDLQRAPFWICFWGFNLLLFLSKASPVNSERTLAYKENIKQKGILRTRHPTLYWILESTETHWWDSFSVLRPLFTPRVFGKHRVDAWSP